MSGNRVHDAREGQAQQISGMNPSLSEQSHINSQILATLSALGACLDTVERPHKNLPRKPMRSHTLEPGLPLSLPIQ